jgi:hypothetical protein
LPTTGAGDADTPIAAQFDVEAVMLPVLAVDAAPGASQMNM